MPKAKSDGAEEPTINNFFKIVSRNFLMLLKCRSTEANRNISYQHKSTEILLGDKCPRGLILSTSRDTCQVEKNKL